MFNIDGKHWPIKAFLFLIFCSAFFPALTPLAQAGGSRGTVTVFGPETFSQETTPVVETISLAGPSAECALNIDNGADPRARASRIHVKLNNTRIGANDFNQEVVHLERPVTLGQDNRMGVAVWGEPRASISISITCPSGHSQAPSTAQDQQRAKIIEQAQNTRPSAAQDQARQVTQYWPYLEWALSNPGYTGNPFDLAAETVFTHQDSGEQIRTGMFYAGGNQWRFRFKGTRLGIWTFTTRSVDPDLDGHTGTVNVVEQRDPVLGRGTITDKYAPFWAWENGQAFVPTLVMRPNGLLRYLNHSHRLDQDIEEFIKGHGFAGFHLFVPYTWFNVRAFKQEGVENVSSPDLSPDPRAFDLMEEIIEKIYQAGGFVHIWNWGKADSGSSARALYGGVNGPVMQRLQRYLAARLGAVSGWTLGFGYDVWAEQDGVDLEQWYDFYKQQLGWEHVIGARAHYNDEPVTEVMTDELDYLGHEDHGTIEYKKRAYDRFVEWLETYPDHLHVSGDRFRVCPLRWRSRAFTPERVRRTLWHSGMVGGVAAIYGQCNSDGELALGGSSYPFENKHEFFTFAAFFKSRLSTDLHRDEWLVTDGYGLVSEDGTRALGYIEDAATVELDLSEMRGPLNVVAIDTRRPYQEQPLGQLTPGRHTLRLPRKSDWAFSVGNFRRQGQRQAAN